MHPSLPMAKYQADHMYFKNIILATSKYNGLTVAGSPNVLQTSLIIETLGVTAQAFDIFVTGPGNTMPPVPVPVRCYQQKDKNLLAEFKPLSAVPHKIEVLHNCEKVSGSNKCGS